MADKGGGLSALLGPASIGLSLAGTAFGMFKNAQAKKKNQAMLDKQQAENKAIYDKNASQSFLDTNVAKGAVKVANNTLQDDRKEVAGRQAITGGSDELAVAQNTRVSKNYSDSLSRIAGAGTGYQQNQEAMYRGTKANLDDRQAQINQSAADSGANLADNAGQLLNTAVMGIDGKKKKE